MLSWTFQSSQECIRVGILLRVNLYPRIPRPAQCGPGYGYSLGDRARTHRGLPESLQISVSAGIREGAFVSQVSELRPSKRLAIPTFLTHSGEPAGADPGLWIPSPGTFGRGISGGAHSPRRNGPAREPPFSNRPGTGSGAEKHPKFGRNAPAGVVRKAGKKRLVGRFWRDRFLETLPRGCFGGG